MGVRAWRGKRKRVEGEGKWEVGQREEWWSSNVMVRFRWMWSFEASRNFPCSLNSPLLFSSAHTFLIIYLIIIPHSFPSFLRSFIHLYVLVGNLINHSFLYSVTILVFVSKNQVYEHYFYLQISISKRTTQMKQSSNFNGEIYHF